MTILPLLQRALAGEHVEGFPMTVPPPIAKTLGFQPVTLEDGTATFRLDVKRDRHANPMGTVHGGVLVDLADAAMGMACASRLELGESFTTIELKINYFRPVIEGMIEARARVINGGRSVVYLECDVATVADGKLVAKTASTCMVLRGAAAKGR